MRNRLALAISLLAVSAHAAIYYVRTDGDDGNVGTADNSGGAWLTVGHAAATAVAGDTVNIRQGTYHEFVTLTHSGNAGSPITFNGEMSGTNWLTIIDPSSDYSAGWVAAPEIGSGVFKQTGMPWETREMTIDGKRVAFAKAIGDMTSSISAAYTGSGMTSGSNLLTSASSKTVTFADTGDGPCNFWDAVKALYCASNSVTYLRLRDGSDPNGLAIRCARNIDGSRSAFVSYATMKGDTLSYVTLNNLRLQGAFCQVYLSGASHHITVENCFLANGAERVYLESGPYQNLVTNCTMTCNYYGYTSLGAWDGGSDTNSLNRQNVYLVSKFLMGPNSSLDYDVSMYQEGASNVVSGNVCYNSIGSGANITGVSATPVLGTVIANNTFSGHPSTGISVMPGLSNVVVYDNQFRDCNSNVRLHQWNSGDSNRVVYLYRNKFYLPSGVGNHIFVHFESVPSTYPTAWIYNNSFSGGNNCVQLGMSYNTAGIRFINNICSGANYWYSSADSKTNATWVASYDYNLLASASVGTRPAWWGASNIVQAGVEWTNNQSMTFALTVGSAAINAGLDIPATYPTLPQDGTVKSGSAWDIGALEYSGGSTNTPSRAYIKNLRVNTLKVR